MSNNSVYPVLVKGVEAGGGTLISGGGESTSLRATVESAMRQVLGWRPRVADADGFVAALSQSFLPVEENGSTRWAWNPHSYTIQTDIGAVTGAQASIFKRAQVALEQSLPLLEGLLPLRSDADDDDVDASRALIDSDLHELVNEVGRPGGPIVQRVNGLFDLLLGVDFNSEARTNPAAVGGHLGRLGERLGLEPDEVNTIEEEQNLTNFIILADYVISLRESWRAQQEFFDRDNNGIFLGTQLVLVNRSLATLAESVYEARDLLDSVFLSEAERETIELAFEGQTPITIAELFDWVEQFAANEAPRLIREGGKDGAIAIAPTLERLSQLLRAAWDISQDDSDNLPPGFHSERVQRALEELTIHADEALKRVSAFERNYGPEITCVEIAEYGSGNEEQSFGTTVDVTGQNFAEGAEIHLVHTQKNGDKAETWLELFWTKHSGGSCITGFVPVPCDTLRKWAAGKELSIVVVNPHGESARRNIGPGSIN